MPNDQTAARRPIKVGDALLCDGWAYGFTTMNSHPCVADEPERMISGRLYVGARDALGISHLYPVERFRHADPQLQQQKAINDEQS